MLFPTSQDWIDWGIEDEVHQFFCLHWTELFDPETPDTWQVRSSNIRTILEELVDAARMADGFDAYRGVMRSILDEAFAVAPRDSVLQQYFPFVVGYLEPWRKAEIGEKAVAEIERLAIVILGNLASYWENAVTLVIETLKLADKKQKKELYAATMNLAVETVSRGKSANFIRDLFITKVLTKSESSFLDRVSAVFEELREECREYRCIFLIEGIRQKDADGLPSDVQLMVGKPKTEEHDTANSFYKRIPKTGISLAVNVKSGDPESARFQAEERLGELFAAKNLFSIEDRFGIKATDALVENDAGHKVLVKHRRLGAHYLGSYEALVSQIDTLFRVQEHLKKVFPADAAQMAAAIEYHRIALSANSDEARLVNLWIALEALCQGGHGSIIERVCKRVAPCVSIDNVRKTLVSLSIYVRKLWTESDMPQFLELFPNSDEDRLDPVDLTKILLLPDKHENLMTICELCQRHPLILHRLFRTRSMTLDKPGSIKANIEYTRQNIEWQIKRIYRVRNAIVHSGTAKLPLSQLTQHLHCYLVKTIHSILTDLDRQPQWSVRDSLEHRRQLFEHVLTLFQDKPGCEISIESIIRPDACMSRQFAPFAWPHLIQETK